MRMKVIGGLVIVLLCLPRLAAAQDHTFYGVVGIGPTSAFGSAGDALSTGFNFTFGGAYRINQNLALRMDALASRHDVKSSVRNQLGVGNGDAWLWDFDGDVVVSTPMHGRTSFYGVGGIGVYYRRLSLSDPFGTGVQPVCQEWLLVCPSVPFNSTAIVGDRASTDFGVNAGVGMNVRVSQRQSAFVEFRYHYIWGPSQSAQNGQPAINAHTELLPITFGVKF
jgi:hypothetical protein